MKIRAYIFVVPEHLGSDTTTVVFTKADADDLKRRLGKAAMVIPNTLDIPDALLHPSSPVFTTCYGQRRRWKNAAEAIAYFKEGAEACDGSERERYTTIMMKLMDGEVDVDDER